MLNPSRRPWKHIKSASGSPNHVPLEKRTQQIVWYGGDASRISTPTMFLPIEWSTWKFHHHLITVPTWVTPLTIWPWLDSNKVHAFLTFGCRCLGTDHFPHCNYFMRWGPGTITTLDKRSIHVSQGTRVGGADRARYHADDRDAYIIIVSCNWHWDLEWN